MYGTGTPDIFLPVKGSREMLARFGFVRHFDPQAGEVAIGDPHLEECCFARCVTSIIMERFHSWASASRKLTPALAFQHPEFYSGTGLKKWRALSA